MQEILSVVFVNPCLERSYVQCNARRDYHQDDTDYQVTDDYDR